MTRRGRSAGGVGPRGKGDDKRGRPDERRGFGSREGSEIDQPSLGGAGPVQGETELALGRGIVAWSCRVQAAADELEPEQRERDGQDGAAQASRDRRTGAAAAHDLNMIQGNVSDR